MAVACRCSVDRLVRRTQSEQRADIDGTRGVDRKEQIEYEEAPEAQHEEVRKSKAGRGPASFARQRRAIDWMAGVKSKCQMQSR